MLCLHDATKAQMQQGGGEKTESVHPNHGCDMHAQTVCHCCIGVQVDALHLHNGAEAQLQKMGEIEVLHCLQKAFHYLSWTS